MVRSCVEGPHYCTIVSISFKQTVYAAVHYEQLCASEHSAVSERGGIMGSPHASYRPICQRTASE